MTAMAIHGLDNGDAMTVPGLAVGDGVSSFAWNHCYFEQFFAVPGMGNVPHIANRRWIEGDTSS